MINGTRNQSSPALVKFFRTVAGCLLFLAVLWMSQDSAKADTITFELDPIGFFPNGSQSVQSNLVRFSASNGGALVISQAFSPEFLGTRGLAVFGTPNVNLIMEFAVPINSLTLSFGNDDPLSTAPGDTAILQVFFDDEFVEEISVLLNRNDIMDQQISFSGATFNRAFFHYSQDLFLAETVDNIEFTPVPEPTSVA